LKHYDDWFRLSEVDQQIIPEYKDKLDKIKDTFAVNQEFFDAVASFTTGIESIEGTLTRKSLKEVDELDLRTTPTDRDYENLRSTLRQIVREWSEEGEQERITCFSPILNYLKNSAFNHGQSRRNDLRILVPGAGLGRLAWEINRLGFEVQGNEFSLYMLLTSQFIMNNARYTGQYRIIPFAFPLSNHLRHINSLRTNNVPDLTADTGMELSGDFSMTAGDFVEIYNRQEEISSWDCVVTCFFLDTAQNVLEYLRVIRGALKPGGIWINLGPLQYHFESAPEMSVELTWDEISMAAERMGFEFEENRVLNEFLSLLYRLLNIIYLI
jgi:carnosine N-methyltransferase